MFNFQKGVFHPFSFKTLLISAAFLLLLLTAFTLPAAVMVSTTQGSRELPIYCVQTDQKKIALTFDAAWGNEDTAEDVYKRQGYILHKSIQMTIITVYISTAALV